MEHKERPIILLLAALQFLHILDFVIMMPLGPIFMKVFSINSGEFGFLVSAYTFSAGVFGFVGAFFLDRFDRKPALIFVSFGFALGTLICALSPTYELLLMGRIVAGAFGGIIGALVLSIAGDVIPLLRRGKATGTIMASFSVASVIGIPIGLALADKFGWQIPFLTIAILTFLFLPAAHRIMPNLKMHIEQKIEGESKWSSIREVFMTKSHYLSFAFCISLMFGGFTVIPFLSAYFVSNVKLTVSDLPYIYFTGGLFTFFTSQWIGKIADKYGKQRTYSILAFLAMGPVLWITNMGPTPLWLALISTTLFMIFVSGRMVPAFAMLTSTIAPKIRGSFMSINGAVQQIASGGASLLSGLILRQNLDGVLVNYEYVGLVSCASLLVSIFLAFRIRILHT